MEGRKVNAPPNLDDRAQLHQSFLDDYEYVRAEGVHSSPARLERLRASLQVIEVSGVDATGPTMAARALSGNVLRNISLAKKLLESLDKRLEVAEELHAEEFQWDPSMIGKRLYRCSPYSEEEYSKLTPAARRFGAEKARDILRATGLLDGQHSLDFYIRKNDLFFLEGVGVIGYCMYEVFIKNDGGNPISADADDVGQEAEDRASNLLRWESRDEDGNSFELGEETIVSWVVIPEIDVAPEARRDLGIIKSFGTNLGNSFVNEYTSSIVTDKNSILLVPDDGGGALRSVLRMEIGPLQDAATQ